MIYFYQYLPFYLDPIAFSIGSFAVRWYSLSYIVAFLVIYGLLLRRLFCETEKAAQIFNFKFSIFKQEEKSFKVNRLTKLRNDLLDFLLFTMFGAIVGGRLGYVFFYQPEYFFQNLLRAVYPFDAVGNFVGIFGMSFYGGAIGAILVAFLFTYFRKINFLALADFVVPAIGAGYFFGRIGNFLNGELYGRITAQPWGMYFPGDKLGLLRHPSQLYEAFFEGFFLFILFWNLRNKGKFQGQLFLSYLAAYAAIRFGLEFFRQPDYFDALLGGWITKGQAISLSVFILAGFFYFIKKHRSC